MTRVEFVGPGYLLASTTGPVPAVVPVTSVTDDCEIVGGVHPEPAQRITMMPTTTPSIRPTSFRRRTLPNPAGTATLPPADESSLVEIQHLRQQIMHLRSTVTEQEETIEFLRDLLAQGFFAPAE